MIVVRFKVQIKPDLAAEMDAAFREVVTASRGLEGVVTFDIGRDVLDEASFLALEVFEDRDALDRQESLPATKRAIDLLGEAASGDPEATIFTVSGSEPWG